MSYSVRPDVSGISHLAHAIGNLKSNTPDRKIPVYGLAVHTSGSGIVAKALSNRAVPIAYAINYYSRPDSYSAHYVIDYDGTIVQIADEHEHAQHIGFLEEQRQAFLSGVWEGMLPPELVKRWKSKWAAKSPAHLFPGPSPNDAYVGIEMLPVDGTTYAPMASGLKYTTEQHESVAELAADVAARWGLPGGWQLTGRLVGHEDVNPLERSTKTPPAGWDPGGLRDSPWIDWGFIKSRI
jgi:hypothetical protein